MNKKKGFEDMTLKDVKQQVLSMINQGTNYRDIAATPSKVNGVVRRFFNLPCVILSKINVTSLGQIK